MSDSYLINLIPFHICLANLYDKGSGKILALAFSSDQSSNRYDTTNNNLNCVARSRTDPPDWISEGMEHSNRQESESNDANYIFGQ